MANIFVTQAVDRADGAIDIMIWPRRSEADEFRWPDDAIRVATIAGPDQGGGGNCLPVRIDVFNDGSFAASVEA